MGKLFKQQGLIFLILLLGIILYTVSNFWEMESYYGLISLVFLGLILLERFLKFESRNSHPRELVIIAILSAVAAFSRIPFAGLPSIQPTSTIIILSAMVFGPSMGFMIGAVAALASNVILGQGPWTPWQMFAWGTMGFVAGHLAVIIKGRISMAMIGFAQGIAFGWTMNLWFLFGFVKPITIETIMAIYGSSLYFDLLHGISNFILIILLYKPWMLILKRIQVKYGI